MPFGTPPSTPAKEGRERGRAPKRAKGVDGAANGGEGPTKAVQGASEGPDKETRRRERPPKTRGKQTKQCTNDVVPDSPRRSGRTKEVPKHLELYETASITLSARGNAGVGEQLPVTGVEPRLPESGDDNGNTQYGWRESNFIQHFIGHQKAR